MDESATGKSFVVNYDGRKVEIAYKSTDAFVKRCKDVFKIQADATIRFMLTDKKKFQVDTDCILKYKNWTELNLEIEHEMHGAGNEENDAVSGNSSKNTDNKTSKLLDLIYWQNVRQTATVLGALLGLLYYISYTSLPSTIYHVAVLFLMVSLVIRAYVAIMIKFGNKNPLESMGDIDVILKEETLHHCVKEMVGWINKDWKTLCQVILREDNTKLFMICFAIWLVAYLISFFTTSTILTIATLAAFFLPWTIKKVRS